MRVPFDYPLIEDDDKPFVYKESGFAYLDNCVAWCRKAGINLVLDLHRAPGFSFNEPEKSVLFGDPGLAGTVPGHLAGVRQALCGRRAYAL